MTDLQKLRQAAEMAMAAEISFLRDSNKGASFRKARDDFNQIALPSKIISLLDEFDARDALNVPISDINDLDDVIRVLGIEDSHVTPAEAVTMLQEKICALHTVLNDLLKTTPDERRDPDIWFARVDAARATLGRLKQKCGEALP